MRIDLEPGGRFLLDFDTRDLVRYTSDVVVVGGGIAGLSAALTAAEHGRVLVLFKDEAGVSNTAWAQGGIAAAIEDRDSVDAHIADTIRAGAGLCDQEVVRLVAREAPAAVERLAALGVAFDSVQGRYALGREGGHAAHRILHAGGDATGAACSRALLEATRSHPRIRVLTRLFMVDLLTAEGRCVGLLGRRPDGELVAFFARSIVLASGGACRLYRESTNVHGATGDGMAAAFRAGATLRDMEFIQFHPTTLYLAGSERTLVTEAVRGDGAYLVDNLGRRFLDGVHPLRELAPRDVVSRAITEHLARPEVTDIYLDLRHFPPGHAGRRFPGLTACCRRYGLDTEKDPIPVRPAAHYFIGGVAADVDGRTDLPGLFACGETSCTGMHGANRLASNSLLEGLVLGARTGVAAACAREERFAGDLTHRTGRHDGGVRVDLEDLRKALASRMWRRVGILRDGDGLKEATAAIASWRRFLGHVNLAEQDGFELENLLLLGAVASAAALLRRETRGTHARRDHPARDDEGTLGSTCWAIGADGVFRPRERSSVG